MSNGAYLLIGFVAGGGLGLLIGWLIGSRKQTVAPSDARLENELRQQLTQRDTDLNQSRKQLSQNETALATALANEDAAKKICSKIPPRSRPRWAR